MSAAASAPMCRTCHAAPAAELGLCDDCYVCAMTPDGDDAVRPIQRAAGYSPAPQWTPPKPATHDQDAADAEDVLDALGDPDDLAHTQWVEAVQHIHEDKRAYPRFPWRTLHERTGAMVPGDLVLVGGRSGRGKSLFLLNFFDLLVAEGRAGLYVGLEQVALVLRQKWACLRLGIKPKLIIAPDVDRLEPTDSRYDAMYRAEYESAKAAVQRELQDYQMCDAIRARAHFAPTKRINRAKLAACIAWAVEHGCQFVIVDHVDRMKHGAGRDKTAELSETVITAKELAMTHGIVVVLASQIKRPIDAKHALLYSAPQPEDFAGSDDKHREADIMLSIWRPLDPVLDADTLKQYLADVRDNRRDEGDVLEPNTMGVAVLKTRLDGEAGRSAVKLRVDGQRVVDRDARDLPPTVAQGIRQFGRNL